MEPSAEEHGSLISALYDSVLDDSHWSRALQSAMRFSGGTGVAFIVADTARGLITHCDSECVDPNYTRLYVERFGARDVRLAPALREPVGRVMLGDELADFRMLSRSEAYAEVLRPADVPYMMLAWLQKSPNAVTSIVIEASHRHGPFDELARRHYVEIMPHLRRAVRLRQKLSALRVSQRLQFELLDGLPFGLVFLDGAGKILESTHVAEEIFRAGKILCTRERRVRATDASADAKLQHAIRECVLGEPVAALRGATLAIPHRTDRPPLKVTVMPVRDVEVGFITARPVALLLIADPQHASHPPTRFIRRVLGVTHAEALLAAALFSGVSLREASDTLQRSVNTCKAQLKSIYGKTGCRSHTELVRMLLLARLSRAEPG